MGSTNSLPSRTCPRATRRRSSTKLTGRSALRRPSSSVLSLCGNRYNGIKVQQVSSEIIASAEETAREVFRELEETMAAHQGPGFWIFGGDSPTVIDAALVPMLQRLKQVGRFGLCGKRIAKYADEALATTPWKEIRCDLPDS
jgi:glutathione S-transferase